MSRPAARVILAALAGMLVVFTAPRMARGQEASPEGGVAAIEQQGEQDVASDASALTDPKEAELDARAAEVAGELRCPVCRNQSVLESNAELSREMHSVVREKLAAGESPDEVKAYFVSRYGEWILLKPKASGLNLLVYGLPLVVLVLGFFVARNRLRKWATVGAASTEGSGQGGLSADDEAWLREALLED